MHIEALGRGRGYVAIDDNGERVTGVFPEKATCEIALEKKLQRLGFTARRCITCREWFRSEGPGHRMCTSCRYSAEPLGAQWERF